MQNYTTIEQSKKLVELGLNPDTADMYFPDNAEITEIREKPRPVEYIEDKDYPPCWSLGALLELMPKIQEDDKDCGFYPIIRKGWVDNQWYCLYTGHITRGYDNSTDAAFEMIVWLLKNNYIKKGE